MKIFNEYNQFTYYFTTVSTFCVKMFSIISHHETILSQFYVFFHESCCFYTSSPWHNINATCLLGHACITNFHIMNARLCVLFPSTHKITTNFNKSFYTDNVSLWVVLQCLGGMSLNVQLFLMESKRKHWFLPHHSILENEENHVNL